VGSFGKGCVNSWDRPLTVVSLISNKSRPGGVHDGMVDVMKRCFGMILFCFCLIAQGLEHPGNLPVFVEGERLFEEGSYQLALDVYRSISLKGEDSESPEIGFWIQFRRLDCEWRSLAGSRQTDATVLNKIRLGFDRLFAEFESFDPNTDFVKMQAVMRESAGDFWWTLQYFRDWRKAWGHYEKALNLWASSQDVDDARKRYLGIVWKVSYSSRGSHLYSTAFHGNSLPVSVLENAVKIAQSPQDISHSNYLLAYLLQNRLNQSPHIYERVIRAFKEATSGDTKHEWLDDALAQYGNWLAMQGKPVKEKNGNWSFRPDFPAAVKVWRRLIKLYDREESRHYRQVESRLKDTTNIQLHLMVGHAFVPGSKIRLNARWRNIDQFELKLFKMDLVSNLHLDEGGHHPSQWIKTLKTRELSAIYSKSFETGDTGAHEQGSQEIVLDESPKDGAYLAVGYVDGEEQSRELILISRLTVMARASSNRMIVWVCDSVDGQPLPGAEVKLWRRVRSGREWKWRTFERKANDQGLVVFENLGDFSSMEWLATARHKGQQNLSFFSNPRRNAHIQPWKIYAFSDRPAYRPEDLIRWKVIIRNQSNKGYSTPDFKEVKVKILDPKGTVVMEEDLELNTFGTAAGQWQPASDSPLGMYYIECADADDKRIGKAQLFRLEEYKRPEMKLSLNLPPQVGDIAQTPRPGDKVVLEAHASYYFGGDVVGADAEVRVYRKPFHFHFPHSPPFPWLSDVNQRRNISRRSSLGSLEHEFKLKTDADGKLLIEFDSAHDLSNDMSYRVEVRVTDSSRREMIAEREVRVSRQGHFASIKADHQLVRSGEKLTFDLHVLDVNEQPVQLEGQVKVLQKIWNEVWWTPEGVEIQGAPLLEIIQRHAVFPPPPSRPDQRPWRLKKRGYDDKVVLEKTLRTDEEGRAQMTFTPEKQGYYSVIWISHDDREGSLKGPGNEVRAEKAFWVSDLNARGLGYHSNGVEIIVDKDTFQSGQTTPVMLSVPANDRWVLLTIESDRMIEHRVVHVEGTVRMVPLEISTAHIPNFYIQAMMVSDHEIHMDSERITVPPVEEFLNVAVVPDQNQYAPRDNVDLKVKVTNHSGDPVEGEVAVAVYDESITYIQQDIAGDPCEVFYGETRPLVSHQGGHWRSFEKLVELEDGTLIDEDAYRYLLENGLGLNRLQGEAVWFHLRDYNPDGFGVDPLTGLPSGFSGGLGGGGIARGMSPSSMRVAKTEAFAAESLSAQVGMAMDAESIGNTEAEVVVRHNFNATAFWESSLVTDANGQGQINFELPDSLTHWQIDARAITKETKVGHGETSIATRRPLLIRLQTPRFLVMGDKVVLSAIVNNQTDAEVQAQVSIASDQIRWHSSGNLKKTVAIPANGENRVDWADVSALAPGEIKLKTVVVTADDSDAVELKLNAFERGLEQMIAWSGKSLQKEISIPVEFPKQRKKERTQLTVQVTPSLAVTMLDALPYLIDYPYGCTEQTMSRFLPAAIVRRTLEKVGLSLGDLQPGKFGGIAPTFSGFTHRTGFEALSETEDVTKQGLKRLGDMQHADGGWGWWKEGSSDPFMSAYVVWGLSLAREAGVAFDPSLLKKGSQYLANTIVDFENQLDLQSWILHALYASGIEELNEKRTKAVDVAWENLFSRRDALNAYSRALLALSAHAAGKGNVALTLVRNLENGVIRMDASKSSRLQSGTLSGDSAATAHWGEDGIYYRWSEGGVEATATALRALMAIDPDHELIEPVVRWLINNRRGAHWSNTRDTSMALLAFTDYLKVSGELDAELQYEIYAGQKLIATERITKENVLKAPSRFSIPRTLIADTTDIRIVRTRGESPIYYSVEAEWFSLEDPIPAAGTELFVRRDYFQLKEVPTLLKGKVLERVPVRDGATLNSGDRVEVVLTIESRNNYEYLLVEDLKPAGLEAVELRSGGRAYARQLSQKSIERLETEGMPSLNPKSSWRFTGKMRSIHQEWRDRKVALFLDKLPEGVWEIRYNLRAEVPGKFSAMPAVGHAMYIPEIRGNSRENKMQVVDRAED
jgi:uncharacterized protein YfaS (alpha-2-macroglobulin family)